MKTVFIPMGHSTFLHDRPWISPWIKSISNDLYIIIHVITSQLSGHCDVLSNRLWRHQQNVNRAKERRGRCVKIIVLSSVMVPLCRVKNEVMYVLSWRTNSALTRVLFWCLSIIILNAKITFSWAQKQFATRIHILLSAVTELSSLVLKAVVQQLNMKTVKHEDEMLILGYVSKYSAVTVVFLSASHMIKPYSFLPTRVLFFRPVISLHTRYRYVINMKHHSNQNLRMVCYWPKSPALRLVWF